MPPTTRDLLVRAGVELLEETSPAGVGSREIGLREIARRAGVSHGAPRRWFPTHRSLLSAIAAVGLGELDAAIGDGMRDRTGRDALDAAANAYIAFSVHRPAMFALMFRHDLLEGGGEKLRETSRPLFARLRTHLSDMGFDDSESRAALLWTGVHGVATLTATGALGLVSPGSDGPLLLRRLVDVAAQAGPLRT